MAKVVWPSDTWWYEIQGVYSLVTRKKSKCSSEIHAWTYFCRNKGCGALSVHGSFSIPLPWLLFSSPVAPVCWAQMQLWPHRAFWVQHRLLALWLQQSCNSQPTSGCGEEHPARAGDRMDVTTHHPPCTFLTKFSQHLLTLAPPREFSLGEWWNF